MAIAANIGGWVADAMVQKGVSVTKVRKIMQSVSHSSVETLPRQRYSALHAVMTIM